MTTNGFLKAVLLVVASVAIDGSASAQVAPMKGKLVPSNQAAAMWPQVGPTGIGQATIALPQASATMEVVETGDTAVVVFHGNLNLTQNTRLAFRVTLPDGTHINLSSYDIDYVGGPISDVWVELWNGRFSNFWPSGQTIFEALVMPSSGQVSYVSAGVNVNSCCTFSGPLDRADVSADNSTIMISGKFVAGETYATINGYMVPIMFPAKGNKGEFFTLGKIRLADVGSGKMTLTVSSGGVSSTRIVYALPLQGKG